MVWIKRNLIFVIAVAVGLLLTGYCGYLLYSAVGKKSAVGDDYTQTLSGLDEMRKKDPFPDKGSIEVAKQDQERVREFLASFKKAFAPFPEAPKEDARGFKDYLQSSIYQLGAQATNANVLLPVDYAFSWSQQKDRLDYPSECIAAWMQQMQEEKAILQILYAARINYLEYIKRVPTACDQNGGGPDYITSAPASNPWGVVTPYSIAFRGFSTTLEAVLSEFAKSSNCFIVKEVDITPSKAQLPQVITSPAPTPGAPQQYYPRYAEPAPINPYLRRRPFGRGPGFPQPQQQLAPQPLIQMPAAPAPPVTILTENPLYITMAIDVVKLKQ